MEERSCGQKAPERERGVSVFLQELGFHMVGFRHVWVHVPDGLGVEWIRVREGLADLLRPLCVPWSLWEESKVQCCTWP